RRPHDASSALCDQPSILQTRLTSAIISLAVLMEEALMRGFKAIATLAGVAMFACLLGSPDALAQQINAAPPLGAKTSQVPRSETKSPNPAAKQVQSVPAPATNFDRPQTDRSSSAAPPKRRAVIREVARRISVGGGVLVLPEVAYYGVPVILDVPGIGLV